ncbi:MAG TPA: aminoacyl-tRNA hydrolase [Candidatus Limnocylindrales bacterium]|nr:aminoacyl-tRNA hydrolase [Candidatus Limnocylindrales bacterium]
MKLIVGLGNPGIEYQFTPHNIGFLAVDRIAEQCGVLVDNRHCKALTGRGRIGNEEILLAKPETYMNLSGMSVLELVRKYESVDPQMDLIVIYDELDLPLGMIRIRPLGSSAGHNGMQSIINALQTEEVQRIRIGVAPDDPKKGGAKYILAPFRKSQLVAVDEALDLAAKAVETIIAEGISVAMNRFNRKNKAEEPAEGS